jgi:uncharacterized protein YndB with AHSA1/START domain
MLNMSESNLRDVVVTRTFNAPVELVWKVWVDPELVKKWWSPQYFTTPSAVIDLRVGGKSIVSMQAPGSFGGQRTYSIWEYTKIVELELIEFIHNLSDADGNKISPQSIGMPADFPEDIRTVVTFTIVDENKTEMTVTEYGWTEGQMRTFAEIGLNQSLDKVEAIFDNK